MHEQGGDTLFLAVNDISRAWNCACIFFESINLNNIWIVCIFVQTLIVTTIATAPIVWCANNCFLKSGKKNDTPRTVVGTVMIAFNVCVCPHDNMTTHLVSYCYILQNYSEIDIQLDIQLRILFLIHELFACPQYTNHPEKSTTIAPSLAHSLSRFNEKCKNNTYVICVYIYINRFLYICHMYMFH